MSKVIDDLSKKEELKIEMESGCFVCHGAGHWAREVRRSEAKNRIKRGFNQYQLN